MKYFASKTHNSLNGNPFDPELYIDTLCLNPKYMVKLKTTCEYILDSGAFQDVNSESRLSFEDALKRQLIYESRVGMQASYLVSYDRLVDEQKGEHGQFKQRVNQDIGLEYVNETILAAQYLSSKRNELYPRKLILSCQGTSLEQYIYCVKEVCKYANSNDIIGLGGFCIISKSKKYEEQYYSIISQVFPFLNSIGIYRVHLFGVGILRVLIKTELIAQKYGIDISYDTSSAEINGIMGRVFDPLNQTLTKIFDKSEKKTSYQPADLAIFNIKMIKQFWETFNDI